MLESEVVVRQTALDLLGALASKRNQHDRDEKVTSKEISGTKDKGRT
ncbi:MAG: hypothetical protein QOF72_622 [Blastocatellia bacterium]|jgi:hypothetical protein|nr:hypothetical protein [Blastocatellia bacterium]